MANHKEISILFKSSNSTTTSGATITINLNPLLKDFDYFYVRSVEIPDQGYSFTSSQTFAALIYGSSLTVPGSATCNFNASQRYTWQELREEVNKTFGNVFGFQTFLIDYEPVTNKWYFAIPVNNAISTSSGYFSLVQSTDLNYHSVLEVIVLALSMSNKRFQELLHHFVTILFHPTWRMFCLINKLECHQILSKRYHSTQVQMEKWYSILKCQTKFIRKTECCKTLI